MPRTRSRLGFAFAAVAVAAMVGFWAYLFLLADPDVPDELEDDRFPEAAQDACAAAQDEIDGLPSALEAASPQERARSVDDANRILRTLVDDLAASAPRQGDDAPLVELWLDDWRTYLGDREAYVETLQAGEDAELLITARDGGGGQITETIDHFARINDMPDCQVPLDA